MGSEVDFRSHNPETMDDTVASPSYKGADAETPPAKSPQPPAAAADAPAAAAAAASEMGAAALIDDKSIKVAVSGIRSSSSSSSVRATILTRLLRDPRLLRRSACDR